MLRNNLEIFVCKMIELFNFEKNESKFLLYDFLRSFGGYVNYFNFRLKSLENGNKKNNFLFCE